MLSLTRRLCTVTYDTYATPRWLVTRGLQTIRELNRWLITVDDHRGLDVNWPLRFKDNLYLVRNNNRRLLVATAQQESPGFPLHVTSQTARYGHSLLSYEFFDVEICAPYADRRFIMDISSGWCGQIKLQARVTSKHNYHETYD